MTARAACGGNALYDGELRHGRGRSAIALRPRMLAGTGQRCAERDGRVCTAAIFLYRTTLGARAE